MPRKPLIRTNEYPYHVFGRSNNKDWFALPLHQVWNICQINFDRVHQRYGLVVHAFVLMNNHYHLLARTPQSNLGEVMNDWAREVSRSIARETNRINHIFGGRYKWCIVSQQRYYDHIYRYVYRNPIEAGLCHDVQEYPFSTWKHLVSEHGPGWMNDRQYCDLSTGIPIQIDDRADWINVPYQNTKEKEVIQKGLRKPFFAFSSESRYRKTIRVLDGF